MRSVLHPAAKIEVLEDRRLMSVNAAPSGPDVGKDLQLLSDVENDTTPVISETVDPVERVSLPGGFNWWDGSGGRDLISFGAQMDYVMVDGWNVWPRDFNGVDRTGEPSEVNTRWLANYAVTQTDLLVIDIENWQTDLRYASKAIVDQNIARFVNILRWIREEQPDLKVGIYSIFPVSDLYATVQYELYGELAVDPATGGWYRYALPDASNQYAKLQNSNAYFGALAAQVDYIFPALYSSSPDVDLWQRYAKNSIYEARRYGKPVIPFIMPTYHHAATAMNRAVVPAAMWQAQLDYLQEYADGAIIWQDGFAPLGPTEYWITIAVNEINGTGGRPASVTSSGSDGQSFLKSLDGTKSTSYWGIEDTDEFGNFSDDLIAELQ